MLRLGAHRAVAGLCEELRHVLAVAEVGHLAAGNELLDGFGDARRLHADAVVPQVQPVRVLVVAEQHHALQFRITRFSDACVHVYMCKCLKNTSFCQDAEG